jgi:hypothetical protein
MATKDFNDLQNKAYGANTHEQNCSNNHGKPPLNQEPKSEDYSIINDRNSISQDGYLDGLWMSQDYIHGLEKGLNDGIIQGRQRILNSFRRDLKTIRQATLKVDLASVCDNFPQIESKPVFQLPRAS